MGSRVIVFLGIFIAMGLLISPQVEASRKLTHTPNNAQLVAPKKLANTSKGKEVEKDEEPPGYTPKATCPYGSYGC